MKKRERTDAAYLVQLGMRIKNLRNEKGITQADLGFACDIEKSNMSRLEAGNTNPSVLMLKKVAAALDIKLSELLDFE